MKKYITLILLLLNSFIYSQESLGKDSGGKDIFVYSNIINSDTALLIIGGIHGDETDTINVVNYIKDNINTNITTYFIPEINPTLSDKKIIRRGYLNENLDNEGFVKESDKLLDYTKSLYYRIFYGNNNTYKNSINYYVDPNRDFINQRLPSTRILIKFINDLSIKYQKVIILSIHGYMSFGRVYPEYSVDIDKNYSVENEAWELAKVIATGANYIPEMMYTPAIPIIERFSGELIVYTGKINNVTAFDIEIDGSATDNNLRTLNGVQKLLSYLNKE